MRALSRSIQVAIVGAGPAGLAVSSRLARLGCPHIVLERERVGWSWRTQRWDSFRLNTPTWANRALGTSLGQRDTFASARALLAGLEERAKTLPVVTGVEVLDARYLGSSWRLDTTRGPIAADALVVASGFQNVPHTPSYAGALPVHIKQLHAGDYRSPRLLDDGVLVVGGGQSGLQIAEDLVDDGKRVYLATSRVGRLPRRFAGRDAFEWLVESGQLGLTREEADPRAMGATAPQLSGAGGGRTVSYQALAARGVTLLGRAAGWKSEQLELAADLGENVRFADEMSSFSRATWKKSALLRALDRDGVGEVDAADEPAPHLYDAHGPVSLDLAAQKISTVVWATGFGPSIGWLPPHALDSRRHPRLPGLHVIGAPWLTHRSSASLYGMATDADRVVAALAPTPISLAA
jgi:putative flavoprotein involved in K+ transport